MKKTIIIIVSVLVILSAYAFYAFNIDFKIENSDELGRDTPENLIRTIYNPVFKDTVTFLKFSSETEGNYTLLEIDLAPKGENITHYHQRFSETFIPMEGSLGVEHNGVSFELDPGQTATVKTGENHRFFNPTSERIKFQVKIEPGSTSFEKALYLMYGLAQDGYMKDNGHFEDFGHTALFVKLSDTRAPGLINLLNPLLKRKMKALKKNGSEQELLERYYFNKTEAGI